MASQSHSGNRKFWLMLVIASASCIMMYITIDRYIPFYISVTIQRSRPASEFLLDLTHQFSNETPTSSMSRDISNGDSYHSASDDKMVLLLAYQRVGSSFIGSIFNQNPEMFYVYEPLDAVYTKLYGTKKGWAVPMDIHFHWNRTHREMPSDEKNAIAQLLEHLFTCDFDGLITESLIHEFWAFFQPTLQYSKCLKLLQTGVVKCRNPLHSLCSSRVGENLQKQDYCAEQLLRGNKSHGNTSTKHLTAFAGYRNCLEKQRKLVEERCVPIVNKSCKTKGTRVIKTVRLGADTIDGLMARYDNLKVIHLFRDPRPVAISRVKVDWATLGSTNVRKGRSNLLGKKKRFDSHNNDIHFNASLGRNVNTSISLNNMLNQKPETELGKVAQLYCYQVLRNIAQLREYDAKYPGRVYQMVFETMVSDPMGETEKVYQFINESVPMKVTKWLKTHTQGKQNSIKIAEKWQKEISRSTAKDIENQCELLFQQVPVFHQT